MDVSDMGRKHPGLRVKRDILHLDPCISTAWSQAKLRYKYKRSVYDITYENPDKISKGTLQIELDGKPLPGNQIQLADDGAEHKVRAIIKKQKT